MEYRIIELLQELKSLIIGQSPSDEWMDINKASKYCDVHPSTLRRNVKENRLNASQQTGKMLFKKSDLESWLTN